LQKGYTVQPRLLEIELNTDDPEASKRFYSEQLGLKTHVDGDGLKVFSSGIPDLYFNKSRHFPGKVSISFCAEDIQSCIDELKGKGIEIVEQFGDPVSAIVLQDPDGCTVEIKKQHG
jgi:catechol 2,3-dioxygenase-like lactoylglutathione lyase family enzyme